MKTPSWESLSTYWLSSAFCRSLSWSQVLKNGLNEDSGGFDAIKPRAAAPIMSGNVLIRISNICPVTISNQVVNWTQSHRYNRAIRRSRKVCDPNFLGDFRGQNFSNSKFVLVCTHPSRIQLNFTFLFVWTSSPWQARPPRSDVLHLPYDDVSTMPR